MAVTTPSTPTEAAAAAASATAPRHQISTTPARSASTASRIALGALIRRDLTVLRKNFAEFVIRTLVQPFLLVFTFLYVFPTIGQGVGGGAAAAGSGAGGSSSFATVLVPGVVGIAIMFQGVQAVAMVMSQEFGFTREIEDRVQAPCPIWLVAVAKVLSGATQGVIAALIVFPIAMVVHAKSVDIHLTVHWWIAVTLIPLFCVMMSSLGLVLGTKFEPRNIGLMFGFVVLPVTFLGGTYYQWTALESVKIGSFPWLQTLVLVNPLIYVNEGMRAAFTHAEHMHLYVIYPVALAFCALFLYEGLRGFRKRVLS
jgi:ABC-2 type transport system permease protein